MNLVKIWQNKIFTYKVWKDKLHIYYCQSYRSQPNRCHQVKKGHVQEHTAWVDNISVSRPALITSCDCKVVYGSLEIGTKKHMFPRGRHCWDFLTSEISKKIWVFPTKMMCHETYYFLKLRIIFEFFQISNLRFFFSCLCHQHFFQPQLRNKSWDFSENVETGQ